MAGVTANEFSSSAVDSFPKIKNTSIHITKDELKVKILSKFASKPKIAESIYDFYISHIDENNQIAIRQAYGAIFTDFHILCSTYYFAKEYTQLSASDKTYFYEFTYKSKHTRCADDWMGVCHGDDMYFIFGGPIMHKTAFNATDYDFSLMTVQISSDFAKTGYEIIQI